MLEISRKILSFLCAVVFVFSAVMSTTYAWENEQQVLNDLSGEKTKFISVELLKLEKQNDNSQKEIPIANTAFYLFKADNTQIGGRYLTDKNGKITLSLSAGNYYFEEISPSVGYTYDKDENGKKITKYPFTVTDKDETVSVKAYNIRLNSSLEIKKTVENADDSPLLDMQKKTLFEFTVKFSQDGDYKYRIDKGIEQTIKNGGKIYLCHGQTAVFENLPVGLKYTVTETVVNGYTCNSTGNEGHIKEEKSVAEFVNTCDLEKLGSVRVSKEVFGDDADINKEFKFTAKFGSVVEVFTLKHGEVKEFTGIPVGTEYVITESDASKDGYIPKIQEFKGKIVNTDTVLIPFENIYTPDDTDKTGDLKVIKTVKGENADKNKEFKFTVTFSGENAPKSETFTLKDGEHKLFTNIPKGIHYTVTEIDNGGYTPEHNSFSGVIIAEQTAEVEFVNIVPIVPPQPEKTKITVTKQLAGEYLESDKNRSFNFTLTVNGEVTKFALKANETKEFEVPAGAVYQLEEDDYIAIGFSQSIENGYGVAENPVDITVTNTYTGTPMVEIKGEKTWEMGEYKNIKLPDTITIRLMYGNILVEEKVVKPDDDGTWKYKFTAPKYNQDGSLAEYKVLELPIENYNTTYDGYNIINTYVAPLKVKLPVITKITEGKNIPETQFEFVFKGSQNAPMPENSQGNKKTLIIKGAGNIEIGTLTFTKPGEYVYTVNEVNYGIKGWTFDSTNYTVKINVTEKDNVLSYNQTIIKDDKKTDKIVFTNIFDESVYTNTTTISGTKTWNHGNNPEKYQPKSIIVEVYGNGKLTAQREVTVKDNWNYSFELPKLDKYEKEIIYTVNEVPVKNYKVTINGYDLTNTYTGSTPDKDDHDQSDDYYAPDDTTQTGDKTDMSFCIILMIVSLVGFVITIIAGKKKKT